MDKADDKLAGQQIDQYRILRHIARGGMADVYLAEDVDLERKIALKLMLETLAADTQFTQRFRREARAVARLDHPGVVQVYTVGQTSAQQPYIAMQFIEGGSLRDKLQQLAERDKLLTTEQALNIARQIAEALAVAHNARIIHRDLKPGNVLIRPDGKPALVDFGIAAVEGTDKLTRTGGIIGTPHYMSPEQVKNAPLDGRSDLYSLGIILYEMLAGTRPFEADSSVAVLHQQAYEEPPPLSQYRPDLPSQVTLVVETCLKKEPSERFPHAAAMIAAIDRALQAAGAGGPNPQATQVLTHLNDSALISRQQAALTPTSKQTRRPVMPVWVMATLAVMVTAVIMIAILLRRGDSQPSPDAPPVAAQKETPVTAVAPPSPAPAASNTPMPETIEMLPSPVSSPSPISEPTATRLQASPSPTRQLPATAPPLANPLTGDTLIRVTSGGNDEYTPHLSADQRDLLFMSDETGTWQIYSMDMTSGETTRITDNDVNNYHPHFSPDGENIVFASETSGDWEIYLMRPDGTEWQRLTNRPGADEYPSFSPDGQRIVYMSQRDNGWGIYVMDADGQNDRVVIDSETDDTFPVFSPDGQTVVYQTYQGENHDIYTIPWQGGVPRPIITDPGRDANPVYSPDGQWIVFESNRAGNYDIFAAQVNGQNLINLTNDPANDQLPAFSADGNWIFFQSDRAGSEDIYRLPFNP